MTIRRRRRRGPNKPAEERKDYLIQARVPRDLDAVLKQDAKRRRLSVSHLIRNVLQDTYELVDGVIGEVDQIVQDSVDLSGRVTRDAKKIARSAAGLRDHATDRPRAVKRSEDRDRERSHEVGGPAREAAETRADPLRHAREAQERDAVEPVRCREAGSYRREAAEQPRDGRDREPSRAWPRDDAPGGRTRDLGHAARQAQPPVPDFETRTADVYAWQAVVLNRPAHCERCERSIARGETGHLGLSQTPATAPRWLCPSCLALLSNA